ncbi:MAG: class I SAM-dependent methyltransferase [Magnetospirillum sp.]|nr:class I SAM-dependent methyltransferase [Magnetospirillum sp.]
MTGIRCRSCGSTELHDFCDLGMSPLSNAFVTAENLSTGEVFFPLRAFVCQDCFLVQLAEFKSPTEIFSQDYAYFSSYSVSWLDHARRYAEAMTTRLGLSAHSKVVEIASNDGYLLQYFVQRSIPVLGIEPAANVAAAATERGVPTLVEFFGATLARRLAEDGKQADLLLGNNVLAHVPDINDFVAGLSILLKRDGTLTMEFPHLLELIRQHQFDTIYHEHFSYLSLIAVSALFQRHGLRIFDVDQLPTHGGSLRIYACHADSAITTQPNVAAVLGAEEAGGLRDLATYRAFEHSAREIKRAFLQFLIEAKRAGRSVVGYGAAAKGNTLLNYAGVRGDFIDYVVDRNPFKQGRYLPGTHIPVCSPERISETKPDFVLILPWNLKGEIAEQLAEIRSWGGKFVVPIPALTVF